MSSGVTSGKILALVIILFLFIIIVGGIIIWSRYEQGDPVEISYPTNEIWNGTIYIGGAVNLPGYYPFTYNDTIETLLQAAGVVIENYSPDNLTLLLEDSKQEQRIQKIDINRAEKWLLKALPGIGEILAQRIIDYRSENGKFTNTLELLEVDGIGTSIYENIQELITVSD